ncbi:hypothetical protein J6590_015023 [Homalodisca vitripennis]|nr:hypothetical protein J6590_015023 [Homalodisca vitripennis]
MRRKSQKLSTRPARCRRTDGEWWSRSSVGCWLNPLMRRKSQKLSTRPEQGVGGLTKQCWVLVESSDAEEVSKAIDAARARCRRIDGEWWSRSSVGRWLNPLMRRKSQKLSTRPEQGVGGLTKQCWVLDESSDAEEVSKAIDAVSKVSQSKLHLSTVYIGSYASHILRALRSAVGPWAVPVADAGALPLAEADPGAIANPDPQPEAAPAPVSDASAWPYLGARLSASRFPDDGGDGSNGSKEGGSGSSSSGGMEGLMALLKICFDLMLSPLMKLLASVGISL